jgi:hypothetical protein
VNDLLNSLVMAIVVVGLVWLGLAALAANSPKLGKPILEAYLKVLQAVAVALLYGMYYMLLAFTQLMRLIGDRLLKRRAS